ncbi:hypothetical protein MCEMSE15_00207 [Fimbriimonadaceae bacterium]
MAGLIPNGRYAFIAVVAMGFVLLGCGEQADTTKETPQSEAQAAEAAGAWDKEKVAKFKALNDAARGVKQDAASSSGGK